MNNVELKMKLDFFEAMAKCSTEYTHRELVRLLKQVAEFRETNKIEEEDKVIILIPENYFRKEIFKDFM